MRPIGHERRRGFTLVELVAVLAIIALFGAVAVPTILHYRSRRSRDLDNGALVLMATLRAARQYAIQNRVEAGVVFGPDMRRYHVEYEENGVWAEPLGIAGKETILERNLSLELDTTTASPVGADGLPGYVFDPTGMLVNPSALKAVIKIQDDSREVPGIRIEILRPTGRVRIKG
jgi:prepilin-type N-terminal cleavage/methylation domain-containing protein